MARACKGSPPALHNPLSPGGDASDLLHALLGELRELLVPRAA